MTRMIFPLAFLVLVAGASGCRMCGSPNDYCIPAHIERDNDYRGCDTLYRAGSIFYNETDYRNETVPGCNDCSMANAGNWGKTRAVRLPHIIAVPPKSPEETDNGGFDMPTREDLMRGVRPGLGVPETIPMNEPEMFAPPPPPTRPDSPDTIEPAFPFGMQWDEPKFTVEELRRLDPSITDVQILNIEDSLNTSMPNDGRSTR